MIQAEEVRDRLIAAHDLEPDALEIVVIRTTGDRIRDRPLSEVGGKGLFTKEIEDALLDGGIDLAVHSMKDMPTVLPDGLAINCLLERADPLDAFVSPVCPKLTELPEGAVVGSSSLRRQAQIKHQRPDINVVMYRGNVETRLRKLENGEVDATILACAGLKRMGLEDEITDRVSPDIMLPAVAQGAIGVETRAGDERVEPLLLPLNDADTETCVSAERALLAALDGSCRTPIAGFAELVGTGGLRLRGMILSPDGAAVHTTDDTGLVADAVEMGRSAGALLKERGGPGFFD